MKKMLVLAATFALGTGPALAKPIVVYPDLRTERVSYADLNLASAEGRARLEQRIRGAADRVCDVGGKPTLAEFSTRGSCFTAAVRDGLSQMDKAIAGNGIGGTTTAAVLAISAK